jgi:hypothetical protein
MTDDPGNAGQNATIRRTQGLRAAGEVRILGRWKYFERYSEKGRGLVVRTQSAFGLQGLWGNHNHTDPVGRQMAVELAVEAARPTSAELSWLAHHPRLYAKGTRVSSMSNKVTGNVLERKSVGMDANSCFRPGTPSTWAVSLPHTTKLKHKSHL